MLGTLLDQELAHQFDCIDKVFGSCSFVQLQMDDSRKNRQSLTCIMANVKGECFVQGLERNGLDRDAESQLRHHDRALDNLESNYAIIYRSVIS